MIIEFSLITIGCATTSKQIPKDIPKWCVIWVISIPISLIYFIFIIYFLTIFSSISFRWAKLRVYSLLHLLYSISLFRQYLHFSYLGNTFTLAAKKTEHLKSVFKQCQFFKVIGTTRRKETSANCRFFFPFLPTSI